MREGKRGGDDENQGRGRYFLAVGNVRGLKTAIGAASGQFALLGRFREKTRRSVAVYRTISTRRRGRVVGFRPIPPNIIRQQGVRNAGADLGTSRRPARHVLGVPGAVPGWVALWGRPTELGALASSPGQSGRSVKSDCLELSLKGGLEGKRIAPGDLAKRPARYARGHQETGVPGLTPPGWGCGGVRRCAVAARLRLRLAVQAPDRQRGCSPAYSRPAHQFPGPAAGRLPPSASIPPGSPRDPPR